MYAEHVLYLAHELEWVSRLAVEFIDKGKYRYASHDTDLEELDGLCLHALGAVYHHDCGICRHECAVGVL